MTEDNAVLIVQETGPTGGDVDGFYLHNGKSYFEYPVNEGKPERIYEGQIISIGRYFIPIKASIHSHAPCHTDGTDGITDRIIKDDQTFAAIHRNVSHYIVGCGAIGQYSFSSDQAFNIKQGNLSNLCGDIH